MGKISLLHQLPPLLTLLLTKSMVDSGLFIIQASTIINPSSNQKYGRMWCQLNSWRT